MIFYDIGTNIPQDRITEELQNQSLSGNQLSAWLGGIDAGNLVMIIDSCRSEAAVKIEGFKPGPMGSRGLGQLAFDKEMRILAASQKDDLAFEDLKLEHGLLTYALLQGLKLHSDEVNPQSTLTMKSWLEYGATTVPELYKKHSVGANFHTNAYHQPVFFDFKRREVGIPVKPIGIPN
jgi:hypothetical protein